MPFGDETYKIILNTSCDLEKVPEELRPLYQYINNTEVSEEDALVNRIESKVREYNSNDWRHKIMTIEQELDNRYSDGIAEGEAKGRAEGEAKGRAEGEAKGRAEGEAKGRAEGEAKGRAEIIADMKATGADMETICKFTGLDKKEVDELLKSQEV